MKYKSSSASQTQKKARELAKKYLKTGAVIALYGELGAGKTIFAQGFAKGLGIEKQVISPTFVITRQHQIPNSSKIFYHIDLYRLEGEFDTMSLGLEEIFQTKGNIILIEWAEKLGNKLPKGTIKIYLKRLSENEREIEIND